MKKLLLVMGSFAAAGFLYACGGSSSSSSGGGGATIGVAAPAVSTPRTIATSADAAKTASSSKTMASALVKGGMPNLGSLVGKTAGDQTPNGHRIVDTIFKFQNKLMALQKKQFTLGKAVAAAATTPNAETIPCETGSRTFSATLNASNTTITGMNVTMDQCKESGSIENGSVSITGISLDPNNTTGVPDFTGATFAVNMTTADYAAGGYTTKTFESKPNLTLTINSNTSTGSMAIKISGSSSEADYLLHESNKSLFTNFSMTMTEASPTYTVILDGVANMETYKDSTFTTVDTKSGMTFKLLKIASTSLSTGGSSVTIDGTYAIAAIPSCMDGTYVISTVVGFPIITDSAGNTIGGKMNVNGVAMEFLPNGNVTTTIGGQTSTITAADALAAANSCQLSFSEGLL
jgi:hypothetical protein